MELLLVGTCWLGAVPQKAAANNHLGIIASRLGWKWKEWRRRCKNIMPEVYEHKHVVGGGGVGCRVRVCMYIYIHIHVHVHVHIHKDVYIYISIYKGQTHICIYIYMYTHVYTHIRVNKHIYIYIYTCVFIPIDSGCLCTRHIHTCLHM